jgi:hypothetical protein
MVKFVINCMLNIQIQHKVILNVKLIYSIQVLGRGAGISIMGGGRYSYIRVLPN